MCALSFAKELGFTLKGYNTILFGDEEIAEMDTDLAIRAKKQVNNVAVIEGLKNRPELNGLPVIITGYKAENDRFSTLHRAPTGSEDKYSIKPGCLSIKGDLRQLKTLSQCSTKTKRRCSPTKKAFAESSKTRW